MALAEMRKTRKTSLEFFQTSLHVADIVGEIWTYAIGKRNPEIQFNSATFPNTAQVLC